MSSNGTVLDAIQPRNFLAIIGFSASWRMWMYVAGTVPQVIAVFAIIYCFHLQKHRVKRSLTGSGATVRIRPLGAKRLLVATLCSLMLLVVAMFFYNSYDTLQQGQNLSEQCEAVLFAYLNLSAGDAAGSAVSDWKALSGRMQQALALSDRERVAGLLPMDNLRNDTRQRTLLVQHLRQYGEAYRDVVDLPMELGYLTADNVYFGAKFPRAADGVLISDAAPWATSTGLANATLTMRKFDPTFSVIPSDQVPLIMDPFFQILQTEAAQRRTSSSSPSSASSITPVHFVLPNGTVANIVYTTKVAYNDAGDVVGLWFAALDVQELYALAQAALRAVVPGSGYLAVLMNAAMEVVLLSPPLWHPTGAAVTLDEVPNATFRALGRVLRAQGLESRFVWQDPSGVQWRIVSVGDGRGYYYVLGLSYTSMEAFYNPEPFFHDMLNWSRTLDFIAAGVFSYAMLAGTFYYICWLMLRPKNDLEIVSEVMAIFGSICFLAALVSIDSILSDKLSKWAIRAFDVQCTAAVWTQTALRLNFTTLMTAQLALQSLRSSPLIVNLTARSVAIGKLAATDLDHSLPQQAALQRYQWALLQTFPEPAAVYAGGQLAHFGYSRIHKVQRFWQSHPYIFTCPTANITANISWVTAYTVANDSGAIGLPVQTEQLFSLQDANWWQAAQQHQWAEMLILPPEGSLTPRASTLSQFVGPNGTGTSWGFIPAVDLSMESVNKVMRSSRTSEAIMMAVTGAGQLLASNANLTLRQNGHDVFLDEVSDPLVVAAAQAFRRVGGLGPGNTSAAFSFTAADEDQYVCDSLWLNALVPFRVDRDVVLLNLVNFTGVYGQVQAVLNTAMLASASTSVWQGLFLGFGGLTFALFWLSFMTVMGWLRWDIMAKKKMLNLVQKMLGESEPVAHRPALIQEHPPTMSVRDFCLTLPAVPASRFTVAPPRAPAIRRMLSQSEKCLQRAAAKEVIRICGLTAEEALAISIYTYEMQEASVAMYWFSSPTSRFQIYSEMNAALRTEDPDAIDFWHPLLFPIVSGLKKMQRADLTAIQPPVFAARMRNWFTDHVCCCGSSNSQSTHSAHEMDLRVHVDSHPGALVFRGVSLSARLYQAGHEVVWPGFSSCSSSLEVAKAFCGDKEEGEDDPSERPERTMFFVEAFSAVRVSALSHFPNEEEMLLLPGTVFKVVHCGCDKFSLFSHAVRFIQLVELHDEPCSVAPASPFGVPSSPPPQLEGLSTEELDFHISPAGLSGAGRSESELRSDTEPLPECSYGDVSDPSTPKSWPPPWYHRLKHRKLPSA